MNSFQRTTKAGTYSPPTQPTTTSAAINPKWEEKMPFVIQNYRITFSRFPIVGIAPFRSIRMRRAGPSGAADPIKDIPPWRVNFNEVNAAIIMRS